MNIIKLDAIGSTNDYLKEIYTKRNLEDYTVVSALEQIKGRGQIGTSWASEKGKNLTISVLKKIVCLDHSEQFSISMGVSLAIVKALNYFAVPQLKIKWPNDILSANKKICGILIENIIKNGQMNAAVIGIGLNVNQTYFDHLQSASSLKLINGITYSLDEVLHQVMKQLKEYAPLIEDRAFDQLKKEYEENLFRKDKPSTFKNLDGELFMGFIQGVTDTGKLLVKLEDNRIEEFDLKQIKLLY
ncbi:biotin--[acetyl-CoA-carboxylase] ligase [Sungkyunkwania multivorans]|uniref:Biotin--[acetyl-CoA-carboxylase] ligase n=1 Tax=Sungkyunkwania multivorans TaxID=1173618 RepID=A0ABW3CZS5_9FLAO